MNPEENNSIDKPILTTHEVARHLNVFTTTVIQWMNAGKLNGYRTPGGHRRILREELLRFIKTNHLEDAIRQSSRKKILIVEDDEDAMDLYINILEKENYEIKKSYTGFSSGVAIDFKPDLIILDIMLPDFDGFKICDLLRKSPETSETRILVISAISEMRKIRRMYELGANDYLVKPFSIGELKGKIRKLIFDKSPVTEPDETGVLIP